MRSNGASHFWFSNCNATKPRWKGQSLLLTCKVGVRGKDKRLCDRKRWGKWQRYCESTRRYELKVYYHSVLSIFEDVDRVYARCFCNVTIIKRFTYPGSMLHATIHTMYKGYTVNMFDIRKCKNNLTNV